MLLLLVLGCVDGEVTVEGVEAFGNVRSALWTGTDAVDLFVYTDAFEDTMLAPQGRAAFEAGLRLGGDRLSCGDWQASVQAWADASEALLDASDDGEDVEAFCAAVPDYLATMADAAVGSHRRLYVGYCLGDTCRDDPEAGQTLPISLEENLGLLTYEDEDWSYEEEAVEAWDIEDCAFSPNFLEEDAAATEQWMLDGSVVVEEVVAEEHLSGVITGTLFEEVGSSRSGEEAGSLEATFELEWCPSPDLDGLVVL